MAAACFGLTVRRQQPVGRPAADADPVGRRHRRGVPARDPAGARPALATCRRSARSASIYIELIRGVPLITVLFMASFMFPLFLPTGSHDRRAAARAGRHHAVRVGLSGRSGARRPAGDPGGQTRRPTRSASATGRRAARSSCRRRCASSIPPHRQHLHRHVQGHVAGHHHRPVRPAGALEGGARPIRAGAASTSRGYLFVAFDLLRLLLRHVAATASGWSANSTAVTSDDRHPYRWGDHL